MGDLTQFAEPTVGVPSPPPGRVTLTFTKNANLPVEFASRTLYAAALPTRDPKLAGMWGLFPDDLSWQERIAINEEYLALCHFPSGGTVVKDGAILGKIPELGDMWVYRTSLEWIVRSYAPDLVKNESKGSV